jgi:hypothetical protein
MRLNDEQTVYFLDGGKRYRIPWDVMIDTWNLRGKVVSRVSRGLFNVPIDGGNLTYALRNTGSSTIYMPDGADGQGRTVLRAYSNIDVYRAWEGVDAGYVTVSMDYFGDIDDAVGAPLTGTKVICGGTEYQIVNGYRLWQTAAVSPLFPGTAQPVSWPTIGRMSVGPNVTQVIKSPTSPVYVVDSSTRHPLLTNEALNAWSTPTQDITYVNNGFLNLIAQGSNVSGYMADSGGQLYLVNRRKIPVPASLDTAYRNSGAVLSASSSLMALYPSMSPATSFIKSNDSPAVYLMDDSGHRRPIPSSNVITAWGEQPTPTELSFYVVNDITAGSAVGMYATSGGVNYLIDDGKKWTVSASVATDWGLSSPQSFADTTLNRLPTAGALPTKVKTAEGLYYLVSKGKAYFTVNTAVAGIWNLKSAATVSSRLVPILLGNADLLHRFVRSDQQGDSRKFMVESGNWYTVNDTQIANIGGSTPGINTLDPAIAPNTITAWGSVIIKAGDGTHFAMDGGTKHQFTNSTIQNQWTNSGSLTVPTVGNDFLDLMATASAMQKSIKGGGPGIFKGENGTKRLITSSATYNAQFAPYLSVSEAMINSLPNGSDIN